MKDLRLPLAVACTAVLSLSACTSGSVKDAVTPGDDKAPISVKANVPDRATGVTVNTLVRVRADHGTLSRTTLVSADGKSSIAGTVAGSRWIADQRLEPSTSYRLSVTGKGEDGEQQSFTRSFTTQALSLDQQTYPSVAPLKGETVGVGMPVIVTFDVPVTDRAAFEKQMAVTSTPAVTGSWDWFSDHEAHYRPRTYWPAGATVHVDLHLNGVAAGKGIYGQQDQDLTFKVGRKAVSVVDVAHHKLTYVVDGKKVRSIPVTTGGPGHETREGTKVIMEKFSSIDMDAATTGVDSDDPDYYNMKGVRWAMRVTNSGEFLHAAPWSVGQQGSSNVSHGCTGMSTANAAWLFQRSRRGDVVKYIHSSRQLEDRNGWTDWNTPWYQWRRGSALAAS